MTDPSRDRPRHLLGRLLRLVRTAVIVLGLIASILVGSAVTASAAPAHVAYAPAVGVAAVPSGGGYWEVTSNGGVYTFGVAEFHGALNSTPNSPVRGIVPTPTGHGYWLVAADGGVFSYGDAKFFGSMGGKPLNSPVVGMTATSSGGGYWLVAADGGIFSYGDAKFFGSMGGKPLNSPVVGMTATPSGGGYWLVAADGGIFSYGDAKFFGSMGGKPLNSPVVGMTATRSGGGYWLVAADGGVFSYGDANFLGSMGGKPLARPIVGIARTSTGSGYWLVAADGGIFSYGDASFQGRVVYTQPGNPPTPSGDVFADSTGVDCAPGTIDSGIAEGWHGGIRVPIRLCEVPSLASTSEESRNGHALVNSRVSSQVHAMVNAARAARVTLSATSTFRSMAHQRRLCSSNSACAGGNYAYVAKPGTSNHQMGLAIDFNGPTARGSGTCAGRATQPSSAVWSWLKGNADAYGLHQYSVESWHWDVLAGGNRC